MNFWYFKITEGQCYEEHFITFSSITTANLKLYQTLIKIKNKMSYVYK